MEEHYFDEPIRIFTPDPELIGAYIQIGGTGPEVPRKRDPNKEYCPNCGRGFFHQSQKQRRSGSFARAAYTTAEHSGYGCDSGCCGHTFYLYDGMGQTLDHVWVFDHPYSATTIQEKIDWAIENIHCFEHERNWPRVRFKYQESEISDS
jgi:hypothetical protein